MTDPLTGRTLCWLYALERVPSRSSTRDQRRPLVARLDALKASQRATAKAIGVSHQTVGRDVGGPDGPSVASKVTPEPTTGDSCGPDGPPEEQEEPSDEHGPDPDGAHASPWFERPDPSGDYAIGRLIRDLAENAAAAWAAGDVILADRWAAAAFSVRGKDEYRDGPPLTDDSDAAR